MNVDISDHAIYVQQMGVDAVRHPTCTFTKRDCEEAAKSGNEHEAKTVDEGRDTKAHDQKQKAYTGE